LAGVKFDASDTPYLPQYIDKDNDYIVIHPYPASDAGRVWDKWEELVTALKAAGYKIAQVGGKNDKLIEGVEDKRGLPYKDFLQLVEGCLYFIGCDSFCLHVAGALDKKGVALFGNTNPDFAMSWRGQIKILTGERACDNKYPCHEGTCEIENKCINNITVKQVIEAIGG
jgi:ADP-heptose:LPS heptosyltransferase